MNTNNLNGHIPAGRAYQDPFSPGAPTWDGDSNSAALAQLANDLYRKGMTNPADMSSLNTQAGRAAEDYGHSSESFAHPDSHPAAQQLLGEMANEFYTNVPGQLQELEHALQNPSQFDWDERLRNCRAFYYMQKFAQLGSSAPPELRSASVVAAPGPAYYFMPFSALPDQPAGYAGPPASGSSPSAAAGSRGPAALSSWDVHAIRRDFPILHQKVNGKPLIWLDNAATSQKPISVIDTLEHYYKHDNSNVHRGAHTLAARATDAFEGAREKVQQFLGAASPREIVFVRNSTEAINLVAQTYGRQNIRAGDEIVLTTLEHHSNIVPWQMLCQEKGAVLRVVPLNERGEVILEAYERLLGPRTRIVALGHVSNALGTVVPIAQMIAMARRYPTQVLVDGAQAVPHFRVNVQSLDADFYAFSGHKLFGPTGIGVLYGKLALLEEMPPWQGGGSMIEKVTFEATTYNKVPYKFEAGTGHIAGAIGLGAAIDYLNRIGFEAAAAYEEALLVYATQGMATVPGLRLIGTAPHKISVLSFTLEGFTNEEVGQRLDQEGIAVRAGHHCAQPALRHFGLNSTVRPSLAFYNTPQEIDALVGALHKIVRRTP
jgi:cysteine desulfurase/selenocysteine lyase